MEGQLKRRHGTPDTSGQSGDGSDKDRQGTETVQRSLMRLKGRMTKTGESKKDEDMNHLDGTGKKVKEGVKGRHV